MSEKFIHLRINSEYSISHGIVRLNALLDKASEQKMPALAITDDMNLFALVKFYRKAISRGIKPIIGADVCLAKDLAAKKYFHVTLLCINNAGYRNLTCLLSKAYLEGQKNGRPVILRAWLDEMHAGLIVLSGARAGDIGQLLLSDKHEAAREKLQHWLGIFGDRFYLELQRTGRVQESEYLQQVIKLAHQYQVPVVATNEVNFLQQDDFEAHDARVCIQEGNLLNNTQRQRNYSAEQYFKTAAEMQELFSDIPEALRNTAEIAKRCNVQLTLNENFLPKFPVPDTVTREKYLQQQACLGLSQRLSVSIDQLSNHPDYYERLIKEVEIINQMGFSGYFLIVADFINWAKEQKIPVGPGRGSGAGSLVAYSLGITELDPLKYELLFERFLNSERVSMPDFDVDFCMERRDLVIDYVAKKYGQESVSQIITYGTMAAKAVVRDVGRVLGNGYGFVDKIAKLIPFDLGMTLDRALKEEDTLRERYEQEEEVTTLIDLAKRLEGIVRNAGKHAGGIVIAPTKLTDFTPLYCEEDGGSIVSQFDKDDVEAVGLVKFDFLGLRTLTIIDWALQTINTKLEKSGKEFIDINKIPLDDVKTFELLKACVTTAVFQLESRGMKDLIRRLQPDTFEEIIALVALFRPGPLQSGMVDDFINRKHGRAAISYPHPDLETILKPTYGVILYQEQVMQIAQVLANYSLGAADLLRRAMGKKKAEEMAKQRSVFVAGAEQRKISGKVASHIFDHIEKFAGYGFNKSHSAAYALIAYQTAWLKVHYPSQFMAAVLSSDLDNTDKIVSMVDECDQLKLPVIPPHINNSDYRFTVNEKLEIIYGLGAIKGVGEAAVVNILDERRANGPYENLFDLCQRLDSQKVNKRVVEALIYSGALDSFNIQRASLMATVGKALQYAEQKNRDDRVGQHDFFGSLGEQLPEQAEQDLPYIHVKKWDDLTRLQGERESLGYYISGHPLAAYAEEIAQLSTCSLAELPMLQKKTAVVCGLVSSVRTLITKKGKKMAILSLEDLSSKVDITVFSELLAKSDEILVKDAVIMVKGELGQDKYTGGMKLVAEDLVAIDVARGKLGKCVLIKLECSEKLNGLLDELPNLIKDFCGGSCPIAIDFVADYASARLELGKQWRVDPKQELLKRLSDLCGVGAVKLQY